MLIAVGVVGLVVALLTLILILEFGYADYGAGVIGLVAAWALALAMMGFVGWRQLLRRRRR